jgi:hypothetical protein
MLQSIFLDIPLHIENIIHVNYQKSDGIRRGTVVIEFSLIKMSLAVRYG